LALWLPLTSVLASSGIAGKVTFITHAAPVPAPFSSIEALFFFNRSIWSETA
jgi:hypothetical protein